MTPTIFCPSSHIILSAARCPVCGWQRPSSGGVGQLAWQPVQLRSGLGGPGRHVFAQPASAQGVAAFPLNNHEITGLNTSDGKERWHISLPEGLVTRALVADGKRLLLTLSDERQIGVAGPGQLASLDPLTGRLTTLWQADTHQLTIPVLTEKHILLRTSASELIAFQRSPRLDVDWKIPLGTWWALPPHAAAGKTLLCDGLAMQGEGWLKAVDEINPEPFAWERPTLGMIAQPLTSSGQTVIFENGKKQILALDAATGKDRWKLDFERLYAPPVAGGGQLFLVARGPAPKGSPGYYLLLALDPDTGKTNWQAPLLERALIPTLWADERVYLASEDGQVCAFEAHNGTQVFSMRFGSDEDPLRSELLVGDGTLFIGTYSGRVAALRVQQRSEEVEDPEIYLSRGEFESAAAAYVLRRGDFQKAGDIYSRELRNFPAAIALYQHAGLYQQAADVYASQMMWAKADELYSRAGNQLRRAEMLLKMGNELDAARLFEECGELRRAAELFEQSGDLVHAVDLYRQLNDRLATARVSLAMPDSVKKLNILVEQGKILEAAEVALSTRQLRQAVDLFKQAGLEGRELDALLQLKNQEPEEWLFERIAGLARKTGRFIDEAEARENLNGPQRAAEAFYRAASQLEKQSPAEIGQIVGLYQKAEKYFAECGFSQEETACQEAVARVQHTPIIEISGTARDFKENEWNILEISIHNRGYGLARNVRWQVGRGCFDADPNTGTWMFTNLGVETIRKVNIHIRPQKGEIGDAVPFALEWYWQDERGKEFRDHIGVSVKVRSKDDSRPTGQPVYIQAGATYVNAEKYVAGDDISGGQKGDRVEIQRGEGVKLSQYERRLKTGQLKAGQDCPTCHMTNDADAKICNYCGNPLL